MVFQPTIVRIHVTQLLLLLIFCRNKRNLLDIFHVSVLVHNMFHKIIKGGLAVLPH